jgi:hypothetical protein
MADNLALGIALLSLVGQLWNGWMKTKIRADLLAMEAKLREELGRTYVSQEVFKVVVEGLERRLDGLERKAL